MDRCNCFALESRIVIVIFAFPKSADERIFYLANNPSTITFIGEQSVDAQKGSILTFKERGDRIVEDVFEARPP